jgi:hypothetical protein
MMSAITATRPAIVQLARGSHFRLYRLHAQTNIERRMTRCAGRCIRAFGAALRPNFAASLRTAARSKARGSAAERILAGVSQSEPMSGEPYGFATRSLPGVRLPQN